MTVRLLDSASQGIELEQALQVRARPDVLLWRAASPALVVPRVLARRAGVATDDKCVIPRGSGGGPVPQGPGTTNLAIILPVENGFTTDAGYRLICGTIGLALASLGVAWSTGAVQGSFCDGGWNVTVAGRKFAGTAQRWRYAGGGYVALLHAAILITMPTPGIWRELTRLHSALDNQTLRAEVHVALSSLLGASRIDEFHARLRGGAEQVLAAPQTGSEARVVSLGVV